MLPPNTWIHGPPRDHIPNGLSISSAILAKPILITDTQIDRQTYRPRYIGNNRPSMHCVHVMQSKNLVKTGGVVRDMFADRHTDNNTLLP